MMRVCNICLCRARHISFRKSYPKSFLQHHGCLPTDFPSGPPDLLVKTHHTQDNSFCYDLFYLVSSLVDGSPVCCTVKCLVIRLLCGNLTWRPMFFKTLREPCTAATMKGTSANLLLDA